MVNVTCNGMRILVVFVDVYEKCDHLFFWICVCLWAFCLSWSLCLTVVSQWTQVCFGFQF